MRSVRVRVAGMAVRMAVRMVVVVVMAVLVAVTMVAVVAHHADELAFGAIGRLGRQQRLLQIRRSRLHGLFEPVEHFLQLIVRAIALFDGDREFPVGFAGLGWQAVPGKPEPG